MHTSRVTSMNPSESCCLLSRAVVPSELCGERAASRSSPHVNLVLTRGLGLCSKLMSLFADQSRDCCCVALAGVAGTEEA